MPLHVIVDGYNLIHASMLFESAAREDLESGRRLLIQELVRYKQEKGHSVTVVFDGWLEGSLRGETRYEGGVRIVFSRQGEQADAVIKRLAAQLGEKAVVVSSDREVFSYAQARGSLPVSSQDFDMILAGADQEVLTGEDWADRGGSGKKKGPSKRPARKLRKERAKFRKL